MNATTYPDGGEGVGGFDDDFGDQLPQRPRRRVLTPWTALLFAILVGAGGFYVGVRVEKNHVSSSSTSGFASRLSAAAGTGSAAAFAGRSSSGTSASGTAGASTSSGFAGRGGFAGGSFPGGGGTIGTVATVSGNTIYVTETSGNTVKVKLSSATTIKKTQSVSKKKLYPGDSVVITGASGSGGVISATAITDSGASGSTSTSTSGSSSSSSASSAVGSLFGRG